MSECQRERERERERRKRVEQRGEMIGECGMRNELQKHRNRRTTSFLFRLIATSYGRSGLRTTLIVIVIIATANILEWTKGMMIKSV